MGGPAPTPSKLLEMRGSWRANSRPNEPKPATTVPKCPGHLSKEAKAEWRRIVPELEALGLISNLDLAALAAYTQAYGRWVQAETILAREGLTVTFPTGAVQKSPYLQIADKALDQLRKFIVEFGLSPASRTKVHGNPADDSDDEFFG
jgi:P27 family predicted phage terminase small subunit